MKNIFIASIFSVGMVSAVNATIMNVEMLGYISGKPPAFLDSTPVKVGDTFTISFNFDDSEQ